MVPIQVFSQLVVFLLTVRSSTQNWLPCPGSDSTPSSSFHSIDHLADDGQPDACALIAGGQALEHSEQPCPGFGGNTNAMVAYRNSRVSPELWTRISTRG